MNRVPAEIREQALNMLVEGSSMRGVSRTTGMAFNSVRDLIATSGRVAYAIHDKYVRDIEVSNVQADEIWSFCFSRNPSFKEHDWSGDLWTWTAMDRDSKLLISWVTGERSLHEGTWLMADLRKRIKGKIRMATDGFNVYLRAIFEAGISRKDVEYARLVKVYAGVKDYGDDPDRPSVGYKESVMDMPIGDPANMDLNEFGTSFIERHNLTLRTCLRRFMRKTLGHSKKREHHDHQLALFMMYYNFIRPAHDIDRAGRRQAHHASDGGGHHRPAPRLQGFLRLSDELTKPGPRKPYGPRKTPTRTRTNGRPGATRLVPSKVPVAMTRDANVVRIVRHDLAT